MADEKPTHDDDVQAAVDQTIDEAAVDGNKTAQQMQRQRARDRAKVARQIQRASRKAGR